MASGGNPVAAMLTAVFTKELDEETLQQHDAVLNSDRRLRQIGFAVLAAVFGGFGTWAAVAPLDSAALAPGVVQVQGKRKAVQHLEGGIVADVRVANGDYVEAGEPVVILDATASAAELEIVRGRLVTTQALVARLTAERDDMQTIIYPDALLTIAASDARASSAMDSEQALFEARLADRLGEISVLEQQITQLREQTTGLKARIGAREQVAESLAEELVDLRALLAEGYVDKLRLRDLERSHADTLGELGSLQTDLAAAYVAIEETNLKILQLNKRFKTEVVDDLTLALEEQYDLEQRRVALEDKVRRTRVVAPTSGYVLALQTNTVGGVISPGQPLMEIVPSVDNLVIEGKLSPMDIDRIRLGAEAEIRFSVFKDAYSLVGELTKLAADSEVDEQSGTAFFTVEVTIADGELSKLDGQEIVPGMPAEVLIKTGQRTLISYMTSPLRRTVANSLIED